MLSVVLMQVASRESFSSAQFTASLPGAGILGMCSVLIEADALGCPVGPQDATWGMHGRVPGKLRELPGPQHRGAVDLRSPCDVTAVGRTESEAAETDHVRLES